MREILAKQESGAERIRGNPAGFPDAAHKRLGHFAVLACVTVSLRHIF